LAASLALLSLSVAASAASPVAGQENASPLQAEKKIEASGDWTSFQKLEGVKNQGTATLTPQGKGVRIGGALATPFHLGSIEAIATSEVRLYVPKREATTDHGSACLSFYGTNRSDRLSAFVCFNLPGMKEGEAEAGFLARNSKRIPITVETWHTMKMEIMDGLARMKIWADGAGEPDWLLELSVDSCLQDIDGVGVRTYGQPILFEDFSASGTVYQESLMTLGSQEQGIVGKLRHDGSLKELRFRYAGGWRDVELRGDAWRGPSFGKEIRLHRDPENPMAFVGQKGNISYGLGYNIVGNHLQFRATVKNTGSTPFAPQRIALVLGVDSFMDAYPHWNKVHFPTFFRCEPTHLWGYMMSPDGNILGVSSPDPVGSYTIEYIRAMYAHHIYTASLDLLQAPPTPDHHPKYAPLEPDQEKSWTVTLVPIETLSDVKPALALSAAAPMFDLYRTTLEPGQPAELTISSSRPVRVTITDTKNKTVTCEVETNGENQYQVTFNDTQEIGYYLVCVKDDRGKTAIGRFFVRPPWSWYLKKGRTEALRLTPRGFTDSIDGYSCECYYGLLGFYLAARYFPEQEIDEKGDQILEKVLRRLFKEKDGMRFSGNAERITNGEFMISLLVKRYQATGDIKSLQMANEFAEFLLSRQHEKGYYGGYGMAPYTSVLYPAKALMELMTEEKLLGVKDPVWQERYDRHYASVKRAMDELIASGTDVKTEGSYTFEDGAIACSGLQLGMFALLQDEPEKRKKYADAARMFITGHASLTRLLDTDARSHGATARWWEAWNDVRRGAQMMTSPHGWSGWRMYGVWYLYLLTGEEQYLQGVMNALGAGTQLMEWPSGTLRQAFVIDPHVHNFEYVPDAENTRHGKRMPRVTSQDYIKTIGNWFGRTTEGSDYLDRVEWEWTGDGIPYEIFKAMEEITVSSAYVLVRADGSLAAFNCTANRDALGTILVQPGEEIVSRVHLNCKKKTNFIVRFHDGKEIEGAYQGLNWVGGAPTHFPEHLDIQQRMTP
jgi:hypothetical protein